MSSSRILSSGKFVTDLKSLYKTCKVLTMLKRASHSESDKRTFYDIIIAGGGMVGTTMACKLGQNSRLADKTVLLLEGSPERDWQLQQQYSNRVSALNPNTRSLMESLGVWKEITEMRFKPVKKMQVWDAVSDAMVAFNHEDFVKDVAYIVENDVLMFAVTKQLKNLEDNVSIRYKSKVKQYFLPGSISNTSENVKLELEDGSRLSCSLLIGADGANSEVRKAMGVQYLSWNYNQMGIVATVQLSEPTDNVVAWQRFLPTGPIALLPLTDDLSSVVWSTTTEHAKELLKLSDEAFIDALNDALWKRYPRDIVVDSATKYLNKILETMMLSSNAVRQLQPSVSAIEGNSRAAFPLGFGHSTKYVSPGVALIGDAAHRVHPLAGQGVNLGFGDIQTLSEEIDASVSEGRKVGSLTHLLDYETQRQRHNVPTMFAIDGLQKLYGTTVTPFVMLRSLGLQLVHSLPPIKKAIMSHAAS